MEKDNVVGLNAWIDKKLKEHASAPMSQGSEGKSPNTSTPTTASPEMKGAEVRKFNSGATRGSAANKLDYEGFESPAVMRRFATYMNRHRVQPDGSIRGSDNWQKGIPQEEYLKSLIRHVVDVWLIMRGFETCDPETGERVNIEDALCGVRFNTNGLLFEKLKERK